MRVDLYTGKLEAPDRAKTERSAHADAPRASEASLQDSATITFDQVRLRGLEAAVMAQPEMRDAKVVFIRQTIGNGEYAVTGDQLTDAVLNELAGTTER
jgi:anti-sigma28 factor (negative regulator of flagellin synthesis)